ncbi:hypothetical protein ACIBCT_35305 [Streptosporangium sp. NPDC050855]|uniref:hypothetical protein n=1 Tax=Streptosporangium sp. NPDC050855 TaxID=3366194 RepID=UPI00378DB127
MLTEIRAIATDVAREMGNWTIRDGYMNGQFFIADENKELCLMFDLTHETGRLSISASYPKNSSVVHGIKGYSIRVSYKRGAVVIAREIKRRLMPDYLRELESVVTRIAAHEAEERRQATIAQTVATALGVDCPETVHPSGVYVRSGWCGPKAPVTRSEFRVMSGSSVAIEIKTDGEVAAKIAEFLRTLM